MKILPVLVVIVVAFMWIATGEAVVGRVNVAATVLDVRTADVGVPGPSSGDTKSEILRIWNQDVSDVPIGNALVRCTIMGHGGAFGSGISYCFGTLTIGSGHTFGKIAFTGPRRNAAHGSYVVTGGTGYYLGSGGVLHIRRGGRPGTLSLIFTLVH